MLSDIAANGFLKSRDRGKRTASYAPSGDDGEEAFDSVDPGGRGGGKVEYPATMVSQPLHDLGMFMGGVIVGDGMDDFACWHGAFDGVEELDELLMCVPGHATADDAAVENVEGGEQRGGAVTLVIMGHGAALAGLQWQTGLGAIERLDLTLLVNGHHDSVCGRVHVKSDDILDLGCERRVSALEHMSSELNAELEDYQHYMGTGSVSGLERDQFDLDEEDGTKRFKPYRPATIKGRMFTLRRAIGLYCLTSGSLHHQVRLADLAIPGNAVAILRLYKEQLGGNACAPALETMATALILLGRYLGVDETVQRRLSRLAKQARGPAQEAAKSSGSSRMTAKNRARLEQFRAPQIKALLQLPAALLARTAKQIQKGCASTKDMVDAQVACAIAILLHAPIRAANTVSIEVGHQLTLPPSVGRDTILHFEAGSVKNTRSLTFRLPPDVTALLTRYMTDIQPSFHRTARPPALFHSVLLLRT